MTQKPLQLEDGIRVVRRLKEALAAEGLPVDTVYLYGSVARNQAHEWSDIDVAVLCPRFRSSRHEENMEVRRIRRGIDVRIEPICLHKDDFENRLFGLAQEVKRTGVEV